MKYIKDKETGLNISINSDGKIRKGACSLQSVLNEKLRLDIVQFREAQRRVDSERKS